MGTPHAAVGMFAGCGEHALGRRARSNAPFALARPVVLAVFVALVPLGPGGAAWGQERVEGTATPHEPVPQVVETPVLEAPLRLELLGVQDDMRRNVTAALSLSRSADGTRLSEAQVTALVARVSREVAVALEPFGHYEPTAISSFRYDGRRWIATVEVDPGTPVRLATVDVGIVGPAAGDPLFAAAVERFRLEPGEVLSHPRYEALKAALFGSASERGHLDAGFDTAVVRVDRAAHTADVVLHFDPGPRFRFGPVTFIQNVLDSELLDSYVPFRPGDPFDAALLLRLQLSLLDGPWFTAAEIVPQREQADGLEVPIHVFLTPHPAQRFAVGGGYGTDTGPRATFSTELRRLNRAGHRAEAELRASWLERRASTQYALPVRGGRSGLLTLSAAYVDLNPATSDTETFLLGASLGRVLSGWRQDVSLTWQRASFEVGTQSGVSTLLVLGTGLSRVRADDRVEPTRGGLVRIRARGSVDGILSDQSVLDLGLEGKLVRTVLPDTRLIGRAEVGHLRVDDFARLPATFRYFAGGDRSVRGFGYQSLGPLDGDGNVVGGPALAVTSLEVDRRVYGGWRVAAFVDHGNALAARGDPLATGVGAGIRWRSPIGMIRLDTAWGVSAPGSPFRLHLNLGPEL